MHVTKRFAVNVDTQLQTSLNARLHAACTFARFVDTAPYLKTPPLTISALTPANLGRKTNWGNTSAPSPGQNILSLNGHTVKTSALLKRDYPCFARAWFTRDSRFAPRLPSRPRRRTSWGQPRGAFRVTTRPHTLISRPSAHTPLSELRSEGDLGIRRTACLF